MERSMSIYCIYYIRNAKTAYQYTLKVFSLIFNLQLIHQTLINILLMSKTPSAKTSSSQQQKKLVKLAPEVNKIIYVPEELYDVFGRFGAVRQIRKGKTGDKKGTAFIVYQDIYDAKNAVENLNGFNVGGRYLIALYYSAKRIQLIKDSNVNNNPNGQ